MLLVAEVKAFLAEAPPPSSTATKSPRAAGFPAVSPRPAPPATAVSRATTSSDLMSEGVRNSGGLARSTLSESAPAVSVVIGGKGAASPSKASLAAPSGTTAAIATTGNATTTATTMGAARASVNTGGAGGGGTRDGRSFSVSQSAPQPSASAASGVASTVSSTAAAAVPSAPKPVIRPPNKPVPAVGSPSPTAPVPAPSAALASTSSAPAPPRAGRTYPWDVGPCDSPLPRPYAECLGAFVWGDNAADQLGLGPEAGVERSVCTPTRLDAQLGGLVAVGCSDGYTVLVDALGQAHCAGKTIDSTVFVPILEGHIVRQVGCGLQFCIALLENGRIIYFGFSNRAVERLPLPEVVTKVACGNRHCIALGSQGNVYTWGSDEKKQLGHGAGERVPKPLPLAALTDVVDVGAGKNSSCCVTSTGQVFAWGAVVAAVRPEVVQVTLAKWWWWW